MQVTREVCRKRDVENSNLRKVSLRQLFHVTRLFADRSRILYWIFSRLLARGDISEDHRYLSSLFTMLLCFCCVLWVSFFTCSILRKNSIADSNPVFLFLCAGVNNGFFFSSNIHDDRLVHSHSFSSRQDHSDESSRFFYRVSSYNIVCIISKIGRIECIDISFLHEVTELEKKAAITNRNISRFLEQMSESHFLLSLPIRDEDFKQI